jgi:hypothetical protein
MNATDWELFRLQALKAVGLDGHPNANEAYILAWKNGHEGGREEILNHLADIAESILEGV